MSRTQALTLVEYRDVQVKLLLDARAFVNAIDRARWTPLHCAVSTRFDNEQVVNVLLEYGANTAMVCVR